MIKRFSDEQTKHLSQHIKARAMGKMDDAEDFSSSGGEAEVGSR